MAFIKGLFCTHTVHLGPGRYITVGLYSGVAIKRRRTDVIVCRLEIVYYEYLIHSKHNDEEQVA